MKRVADPAAMRAWSRDQTRAGATIGFVPTMGALHEGHLRLIDEARRLGDRIVASVFVNPLQFGPSEDLDRYPRDLERDAAQLRDRGVDCLFAPSREAMYPATPEVQVVGGVMADVLCGPVRPGHFTGVLTVVAKLFHIVEPAVAVFGRKDAQQAALICRMVADLDMPVRVEVGPLVREHDGVAMSSRNAYLSTEDRNRAAALAPALRAGHAVYADGVRDVAEIEAAALAVVEPEVTAVEYVTAVDPVRMRTPDAPSDDTLLAVAARVGATRLIDNAPLGAGPDGDPHVER